MSSLADYKPPAVVSNTPVRNRINCVGVCVVCKRRHDNIGWQRTRHHPIFWFCRDDSEFIGLYSQMPKKIFDQYESDSILKGGEAAGQYLDSIGQTDLAELNSDQFVLFFAKFMGGYEDAMRAAMRMLEGL